VLDCLIRRDGWHCPVQYDRCKVGQIPAYDLNSTVSMVRRRWLLSWLPESGEPDNLDEWARSNLYLIPQKPQKQLTVAAAQQQRYASRWPPARPGRPPVHGMPQGSPYGRFGKSFPPNLPAPLERREEEEREQVRLQPSIRELAHPT